MNRLTGKETGMRIIKIAATLVLAALFWIVVTNLRTTMDRSRQKRTMAGMRTIGTAVEANTTNLKLLAAGTTPVRFKDLRRVSLLDLKLRNVPMLDGWGQPYDLRLGAYDSQGRARVYALRSYGSDERPDEDTYDSATTVRFEQDIVYSNGSFVRYPEGI
jgi:hypothetical protein